jgi:hypothetical protein
VLIKEAGVNRKTSRWWAILAVAAICGLMTPAGMAEVANSAAGGFTVKITSQIHASQADVYAKLLHIGEWWSSTHTFSKDAHNLSIEERPGGCFCEKFLEGGGVRHMQVVFVTPGKVLRMSGGLGPLQALGVAGSLTFALSPSENGARLDVTYAVGGYSEQGLNLIAPLVDQVLTEQVTRLKNLVERGDPSKEAPADKNDADAKPK